MQTVKGKRCYSGAFPQKTGRRRGKQPKTTLNSRGISIFSHPLAQLFEYMPDVYYFVKNRRSEFVDANPPFVEMLGAHRLEDIKGKTDYDFSPRELAHHFVSDDRAVMETGKPIANRVELVPSSDGSINWHITSKVPLYDENGKVVGMAGFTRDLNKAGVSLNRYGAMAVVMNHIAAHSHEPITVQDLASLVHLSVSQFERKFRSLFHVTPVQYLIKHRINRACRMLVEGGTKITEIAAACGFYDHSHFIRQFTKALGTSPHEYRKQRT